MDPGGEMEPGTVVLQCDSSSSTPGTNPDGSTEPGSGGCFDSTGIEVSCSYGEYWWSPEFDRYCKATNFPPDHPAWNAYRDSAGNPTGSIYQCLITIGGVLKQTFMWSPWSPTPVIPVVDTETLVRTAVASLGVHPPTIGPGAYIDPGYESWGLSWWIGAPLWLWVDSHDPYQWGTHPLTTSLGGVTATATITAHHTTFDTGDGTPPITCTTPGTPRPWNPDDPLSRHSPSGCEHTYTTTSELGNPASGYTITATTTWVIDWSATNGQSGSFTTTLTNTSPPIHIGELRVVRVPNP
jgi:hypothetical protein